MPNGSRAVLRRQDDESGSRVRHAWLEPEASGRARGARMAVPVGAEEGDGETCASDAP